MLSYDPPVSVNGQTPASPTNITTTRQAMASKSLRSSKPVDMTMASNVTSAASLPSHPAHHHIWLVTGPAGCGKTMVASHLAEALNIPYVEGDEVRSIALSHHPLPSSVKEKREERKKEKG